MTHHPPDCGGEFERNEAHRGVPVRAIVKDLATEGQPWAPEQQPAIWRDLEDLHALGIRVGDITVFNYVGGKLVDLGHAWTMPHPCFDAMADFQFAEAMQSDPLELDCALVDWGMAKQWTSEQFALRPEELKKCASGKGEGDPYGTDPLQYDWMKWEDDVAAVQQFWLHELYADSVEPKPEQQGEYQAGLEPEPENQTAAAAEPEPEAETEAVELVPEAEAEQEEGGRHAQG